MIVIILTAVGCEKETSKVDTPKPDTSKSTNTSKSNTSKTDNSKVDTPKSYTKPKFNVVFVDKEMREYIEKARNNEGNMDKLYKEIVLEPISYEAGMSIKHLPDWASTHFKVIKDLDGLENEINILAKEDAVGIVEGILEECNNFIHGSDATVYIFPSNTDKRIIKRTMIGGVGGFAQENGSIFLFVNPANIKWKENLKSTLAHEYHHVICMGRNCDTRNLLYYLLLEGRADSFAHIVYPNVDISYIPSISIMTQREVWNEIKPNLETGDVNYRNKVMLGGYIETPEGCKKIPCPCGYAIGYNIVQEFIENNPEVTIDEWTDMKAIDILEKSGYEDSLGKRLEKYNNN